MNEGPDTPETETGPGPSWARVVFCVAVGSGLWVVLWMTWPAVGLLGAFPWIAAGILVAELSLGRCGLRKLRRLGVACLRLAILITLALLAATWLPGMHPRWSMLPGIVLLQVSVVLPLVWVVERVGWLGKALLVVSWLPVIMLSVATHRLPGRLDPEDAGIDWPVESFTVEGADGVRLAALQFGQRDPKGLVLIVHGIGAEKCQFLPAVGALWRAGFEVYTYDQRNHGDSGGWTSTLGVAESADLERVWDAVVDRATKRGVDGPRVLYGVSLGGAASQLAAHRLQGLDGLVLDSTFADLSVVARGRLPILGRVLVPVLSFLRVDVLVTGRRILDLVPVDGLGSGDRFPVLILHATGDPMIPASEARALATAYGGRATLSLYEANRHALGFVQRPDQHGRELLTFVRGL